MIIYTTSEHLSGTVEKKHCKAALAFTRYVIISLQDMYNYVFFTRYVSFQEMIPRPGLSSLRGSDAQSWWRWWMEEKWTGAGVQRGRKGCGESSGSTQVATEDHLAGGDGESLHSTDGHGSWFGYLVHNSGAT